MAEGSANEVVAKLLADPKWFDAKIAGWWVWGQNLVVSGDWTGRGDKLSSTLPWSRAWAGYRTKEPELARYFSDIAIRLRNVKINCGGWEDTLDKGLRRKSGIIAILFDPPYSGRTGRKKDLYPMDSLTAADDVVKYARVMGMEKNFRIAVCGMKDEHVLPGWSCYEWSNHGGNKHLRIERYLVFAALPQPQSQKAAG